MNLIKSVITENIILFNRISVNFSIVGGSVVWFLGGFDTLIIALISMTILDYITGVVKAIYLKKLSISLGLRGIIKKAVIYLIVGVSVIVQRILPDAIPIREITIIFFICNEGLSVLENASAIIPLPEKLKKVLLQLKRSADEEEQTADEKSAMNVENDSKKKENTENDNNKNE